MTLAAFASICIDIVALAVLVGALYIPRHGRRDLVAAYIGVNVGVLAVTLLLSNAQGLGAGLGLGLFGVLSIIRLRSTALAQGEVAYFFAALALGLIGGMTANLGLTTILMALVLAALFVGDNPRLMRRNRNQVVTLDRAISDEDELAGRLGQLLKAKVLNLDVQRLDLVNDTTVVDVRYRLYRPLPQAEVQQHDQVQASSPEGLTTAPPPEGLAARPEGLAPLSHEGLATTASSGGRTAHSRDGLTTAPRESRASFSREGPATRTQELAAASPPRRSERRTQWRQPEQPDQQGPPAAQQSPPASRTRTSRTESSRTSPPSYPRSY
ncbi:DUF4956 domain-containing protein [Actinomyces israelii]|uniref:DUF4956 domain-containing protein n=1 Tax=Actinomyces israelii TaxID=1659 RepID=A0ABT4I6U9_9ACTO|nr:DUF4956 domain-containing protein [Actinomyces israelii]MCZ0857266.1 DUF4956 domain-containing protein [Actinomyces israelii]